MIERLHPEYAQHLPALAELIAWAEAERPGPEQLNRYMLSDERFRNAWEWSELLLRQNVIHARAGTIHWVPVLHPDYCAELVAHSERLGRERGYRPNLSEEAPYRIPEIVLSAADQRLYAEVESLLVLLMPWFMLIYQSRPSRVSSIQFARYEPQGTAHGNWHHDYTSPMSLVVSLAPQLFEGGGTDVRLSATRYQGIPPLPAGYGLLFNGKQIHHRGRAVTGGVRHLLVFWLDH
jgi:hypothetical protein